MPDKDPLGILQSSNNNSTNESKDPLGILSVTPTQESTASSLPTQPEKPTFSTLFGNKDANIPQALPKDYTPVKTLATQYGIKEEDLSELANATPEEAASVTGLDIGKVKELQKAYKSEQIATAATLSPLVISDEKPSKPKLTLEQTISKPVSTATEIPFTTQKTQEEISKDETVSTLVNAIDKSTNPEQSNIMIQSLQNMEGLDDYTKQYYEPYLAERKAYNLAEQGDFLNAQKQYQNAYKLNPTISNANWVSYTANKNNDAATALLYVNNALKKSVNFNNIEDQKTALRMKGLSLKNMGYDDSEIISMLQPKVDELVNVDNTKKAYDELKTIKSFVSPSGLTPKEWKEQYDAMSSNILTAPIIGEAEAFGRAIQGFGELFTKPELNKEYTKEEYDKLSQERSSKGLLKAIGGTAQGLLTNYFYALAPKAMIGISAAEKGLSKLEEAISGDSSISEKVTGYLFAPLQEISKDAGIKIPEEAQDIVGFVDTFIGMAVMHQAMKATGNVYKTVGESVSDYIKEGDIQKYYTEELNKANGELKKGLGAVNKVINGENPTPKEVNEFVSLAKESVTDTETKSLVENEINKIDNSVISKEQPIVEVKPIRQLGTGANVYYESNKYRVNDFTDGDILLNVGAKDMEVPLANISFKDVNEAVFVAKKLQEIYPTGVPEAVLIDRVIDDFKKEYKVNKATEVKPTTPQEVINTAETGNVTDINGLIDQTQLELAKNDKTITGETVTPENLAETNKIPIENVETQKETKEKGLQEVVTKPQEQTPAVTTPIEEGAVVEMPALKEGMMPRKFVFSEGTWKQEVGGSLEEISSNAKQQAENAYRLKQQSETKPENLAEIPATEVKAEAPKTKILDYDENFSEFVRRATSDFTNISDIDIYGKNKKEQAQVLRDLKNNKDSIAVRKYLNKIKEMYDAGVIETRTGKLGVTDKKQIPVDEYLKQIEETEIDNTEIAQRFREAKDKVGDEIANDIVTNDITLDNFEKVKAEMPEFLFDTPEAKEQYFNEIKEYLDYEKSRTTTGQEVKGVEETGTPTPESVEVEAKPKEEKLKTIPIIDSRGEIVGGYNVLQKDSRTFIYENDFKSELKTKQVKEKQIVQPSPAQIEQPITPTEPKPKDEFISKLNDTKESVKAKVKAFEEKYGLRAKGADGVSKAGSGMDDIIDAGFKAVELAYKAGKGVKEAVDKLITDVKGSDFYKALTKEQQKEFETDLREEVKTIENELSMDKDIVGETGTPKNEIKQAETLTTSETGVPTPSASENMLSDEYIRGSGEVPQASLSGLRIAEISGKGVDEVTKYDPTTLETIRAGAQELVSKYSEKYNANKTEFIDKIIQDSKDKSVKPEVKAMVINELIYRMDTLLDGDITPAERDILHNRRTELVKIRDEASRSGTLTMQAMRIVNKLYTGEYNFGKKMGETVGNDIQNTAQEIIDKGRNKSTTISDTAKKANEIKKKNANKQVPSETTKKTKPVKNVLDKKVIKNIKKIVSDPKWKSELQEKINKAKELAKQIKC